MVEIGAGIDNRYGTRSGQLCCAAGVIQADDAGRGLRRVIAGNRAAEE